MSGIPPVIDNVHHARKAGWPTRGDPYGHGVPIVLRERESRVHGEGEQVDMVEIVQIREMRLTVRK